MEVDFKLRGGCDGQEEGLLIFFYEMEAKDKVRIHKKKALLNLVP